MPRRPVGETPRPSKRSLCHSAEDEHAINVELREQLIASGRQATTGPLDGFGDGADVLVTYVDKWSWDVTWYLSSLDVAFRHSVTKEELAGAMVCTGP